MNHLIHTLIILTTLLVCSPASSVQAAAITMEIFYLPHRPAMEVVVRAEQVAGEFSAVTVTRHSFDAPESKKMIDKYQLTDHMPVAIFINGTDSFTAGGRALRLRNFPRGDSFAPMFAGEWDYNDLRAILAQLGGVHR